MNGLNVMTVIPGRNNVPGVYSSNFDPTAHSTMPMLTRLAIGSILIQNANFDSVTCTETCTLALWIKTCPADCADSTWVSIPLGPVVLPPDVHCVAGSLTAGNILVLNLNDGSQIQVDLSFLAQDNDTFPTSMTLGLGNILSMSLNNGDTITVDLSVLAADKYLSGLALGAGNILTATLNDGSTVTADLSALLPVVADGITVLGNGTVGNPLRQPTVAAKMRFAGTLGPIAPSTNLQVPFTSMDYNVGGAGALGAGATFTVPFDCIVHVDAFAYFSFEAWSSAGSVAASVVIHKNGVADTLVAADYSIKGGNIVSGSANEFKTPHGGTDILCNAGDVLTIHAYTGQSSGASHNVFSAYANFHIVGAV